MTIEHSGQDLVPVVVLLGAAVLTVPLFKRLGLGSVLGYLFGGLLIGPFGLGLVEDAATILHIAEFGVVMFLFVIGLEMRPSHLWGLRRAIFGLGSLQVVVCGLLLTAVGMAFGFRWEVAFIGAMGFVMTSTAIVMQTLGDRGDVATPRGQRIVAILLFEDLLIVPLLALVAMLAPAAGADAGVSVSAAAADPARVASQWRSIVVAMGALGALVVAGLWLLNPMFRLLARARVREIMTAAALLVVLGAALLMQLGGLSMALGAFLAGVLLSESAFRHQLEADIEPFRGLLLGLFFLGVGMSLDLGVVARNAALIVASVVSLMTTKAACIYGVARLAGSSHDEAVDRALLMAQGGEFAFVLLAAALAAHVIDAQIAANVTAIIVLSMALTPLVGKLHARLARRRKDGEAGAGGDGGPDVDAIGDQRGSVIVIGFGRVGQIASQGVLARGASLTIIDTDTHRIHDAQSYGFKVFFGDGRRVDVLRAAGAAEARVVLVCVDDPAAAEVICGAVGRAFPQARLVVRAFDRTHVVALAKSGAHVFVRETFESAMRMGQEALVAIGATPEEAEQVQAQIRRADEERLALEVTEGIAAGRALFLRRRSEVDDPHPNPSPAVRERGSVSGPG